MSEASTLPSAMELSQPRLREGAAMNPYGRFSQDELTLRDQLALDRTVVANERTLLAYLRTALALVVAGATLLHFLDSVFTELGGIFLILAGVSLLMVGASRYRTVQQHLTVLTPKQGPRSGE